MAHFDPASVRDLLRKGLLSFPVTDFDSALHFRPETYAQRVEASLANDLKGVFAAGGTGEFFSLGLEEHGEVIRVAVETVNGRVPVIAGTGYGTALAISFAQSAQKAGADGVLVLPQYLMSAEQEGLFRHVKAICDAIDIAVIVYNRDNFSIAPETLARLVEACPNLIGYKDGRGEIEQLVLTRRRFTDELVWIGGMPTAEVFAPAYAAMGFDTYSSAIFNFLPKLANRFFDAVKARDAKTYDAIIDSFFTPYLAIRNRKRGYPVSIVKAGCQIIGQSGGPVRPPLVDLTPTDLTELVALIQQV